MIRKFASGPTILYKHANVVIMDDLVMSETVIRKRQLYGQYQTRHIKLTFKMQI